MTSSAPSVSFGGPLSDLRPENMDNGEVHRLLNGGPPLPPLWSHQRDAVAFAHDALAENRGALLAMEMGTGKTRCALELASDRAAADPSSDFNVLVAAPRAVVAVWLEQAASFLAEARGRPLRALAAGHGGGGSARGAALLERLLRERTSAPVIRIFAANYESMTRSPAFARAVRAADWQLVVCDEAHRLKSPSSRTSKFFAGLMDAQLPSAAALALTGTPLPQSHFDAYGLMRFVEPRLFGRSFTRFKARYSAVLPPDQQYQRPDEALVTRGGNPPTWGIPANMDEFREVMAAVTFRARAAEVLDLPDASDAHVYAEMPPSCRAAYRSMERHLLAEFERGEVTAANAMVRILRLQQIAAGAVPVTPYEGDDDAQEVSIETRSGKREALAAVLDGLPADEPVVVFCRFRSDLRAVERLCEGDYAELSGGRDELADWNAGRARVLGVQFEAGSEGIDLTRARYAVWYTLSWSLAKYKQARARLVRPGQTRPVTFIHVVARNSVDDLIYSRLMSRERVIEDALAFLRRAVR